MVRVEIFERNEWCFFSAHNDKDYAVINAEVLHKSRKKDVRVIEKGLIIWFKEGSET